MLHICTYFLLRHNTSIPSSRKLSASFFPDGIELEREIGPDQGLASTGHTFHPGTIFGIIPWPVHHDESGRRVCLRRHISVLEIYKTTATLLHVLDVERYGAVEDASEHVSFA